jgi:hypothetical protein
MMAAICVLLALPSHVQTLTEALKAREARLRAYLLSAGEVPVKQA